VRNGISKDQPKGQAGAKHETAVRRSIRTHLRDGIEAALRANAETLANCKPRTVLGLIVRGLVLEAGNGKMTALKLVLWLLDWNCENEATEAAPGNFELINPDWSTDGVWLAQPNAAAERAETNPSPNSLGQGISEGILEKTAPDWSADRARLALPQAEARGRRRTSRQIPWGREFLREF